MDKILRKSRPTWRGGIIALGPEETLQDLTQDQEIEFCHVLMKKYYPTVLELLSQKAEEMVEKAKDQANEQEQSEGGYDGTPETDGAD